MEYCENQGVTNFLSKGFSPEARGEGNGCWLCVYGTHEEGCVVLVSEGPTPFINYGFFTFIMLILVMKPYGPSSCHLSHLFLNSLFTSGLQQQEELE